MSINPYRDEITGVLKNKLGIMDASELREQEYMVTRIRLLELQTKPIPGEFDLAHLKAIHQHVFQDVYAWAGQEREINISKKSLTEPGYKTVFTDKESIAKQGRAAHAATPNKDALRNMDSESFANSLAKVHAAWNQAHPFPEGNGRALHAMLGQLARESGHELDFRRMPGDFLLDAAETSLPRVTIDNPRDRRTADLSELREVFVYITDPIAEQSIALNPIRLNEYKEADRNAVQEAVVRAVKADPQWFIDEYKRHAEAHSGRYVSADLFKETFEEYSASKESRNRYNAPVHNSAAVLSAALFEQNLVEHKGSGKEVVFLTGTPGAGKTSSVLQGGGLPEHVAMVFEGQMSNPVTSIAKIQQVLEAGLLPTIQVVHAKPEFALANTLTRFEEHGRGASIGVMASIQGGLPDSLQEIRRQYGDAVKLNIMDRRIPEKSVALSGWQNVDILKSEGQHEHIKSTLSTALERERSHGHLGEAAYRQAAGLPPIARSAALLRGAGEGASTHGHRHDVPGSGRRENILNAEHDRGR